MESILKGSFWEFGCPYLSPDVVVQLRVTAQCWNTGEHYGSLGAFFLSLLKLDRRSEKIVVTWRHCGKRTCVKRQFVSRFGEMWRSVIIPDNISEEERSATSSTFSSEESFEYHEYNVWNSMLDVLCHFEVGVVLGALLDEVATGRCSCVPCLAGSIV